MRLIESYITVSVQILEFCLSRNNTKYVGFDVDLINTSRQNSALLLDTGSQISELRKNRRPKVTLNRQLESSMKDSMILF